jgi:hypothetical protein
MAKNFNFLIDNVNDLLSLISNALGREILEYAFFISRILLEPESNYKDIPSCWMPVDILSKLFCSK